MNPIDVELACGSSTEQYPKIANGQVGQHRESYGLCSLSTTDRIMALELKTRQYLWIQDPERTQVPFSVLSQSNGALYVE